MQLLFSKSEEFGHTKGLDIFDGEVIKFDKKKLKVPHIGWNGIIKRKNRFIPNSLFKQKFYFTHSYYCKPHDNLNIHTETNYGKLKFCSSVVKENIFGTQFHPEKSGKAGLKLLKELIKII